MKKGQTLLFLLVFMSLIVTLTTAAVSISIVNSVGNSSMQKGMIAYDIAESGAENALLRILRDSTYTGETLPIGNGTATITVEGSPMTIISIGQYGTYQRKIEVVASLGDTLSIVSWKEIQ